jgi:hypothetical protein
MKTLIAAVLLLSTFSLRAQESEKIASIRKLMELTGAGKMGVQVAQSMINNFKTTYQQVDSTFWEDVKKEIKAEDLINMIVPIYDRHFTGEEISKLIDFYSTPTGKKILEKMPAIMQESMQIGRAWGEELGKKVMNRLMQKGYIKET